MIMNENKITIIKCKECNKSSDIIYHNNKFWCSNCNNWSDIELISIKDKIIIEPDGEIKFKDANVEKHKLQQLRITMGWSVNYNNGFYEVDPSFENVNDNFIFKQDMLQLKHEKRNRLLDLGWYPEFEYENGNYGLVLYEGDF